MIKITIDDTEATKEEHNKLCVALYSKRSGEYIEDFINEGGFEIYIKNNKKKMRLVNRGEKAKSLFRKIIRIGRKK